MGLASYGEPEYYDDFRKIIRTRPDGWYDIDLSWLHLPLCCPVRGAAISQRNSLDRFGPPRKKGEPVEQRHMRHLAASAQRVLEEAVLNLAQRLHRDTGMKRCAWRAAWR